MPTPRSHRRFVRLAWIATLLSAAHGHAVGDEPADRGALFDAAHRIVADNFFDPDMRGVDWPAAGERFRPQAASAPNREAFADVVNQMLGLLHTSHTRYLTPDMPQYYELLGVFASSPACADQIEQVRASLPHAKLGYVGIGIDTLVCDEGTFIQSVYDGGPAQAAGLQVGDRLVSVAGEPFHPIHSFQSRDGQEVAVTIQRHREGAPEDVRVTPRLLEGATMFHDAMRHSVCVTEAGGFRIGYLHVWSYAGQTYQDLLIQVLGEQPLCDADALVLDLRDGLGGASADYLNLFNRAIPRLVMNMPRRGETVVLDPQWRRPVALVINERVRSGKEVFAWGLKRAGRGQLVGHTTAGAVTAGALHFLPDQSVLYLAVGDVEVDGQRLEGQGVAPTIAVDRPIPYCAGRDPQRDAGVATLVRELQDGGGRQAP
jgi:carboxyl-terminal processing protease